ncbi:hypothetical protein RUND412_009064 [Rhizina undulata]
MPAEGHNAQFTLYSHTKGPNPHKVTIILEELGLSYHSIYVDTRTGDHKKEPFTLINPNGRLPALIDHDNDDFTIWESGAIMLYLVEKYDTAKKISFERFESEALAKQYLMFQMSGQGPYYGQAVFFSRFHPEHLPSAIERYMNEIRRVLSVLENVLKDREYLVEDRVSYADLSFLPWNWMLDLFPEFAEWRKEFPRVGKWHDALEARESVVKAKRLRAEAIAASH